MRTIIAVVDDLFFASKIRGTGEQAGVRVHFAKSIEAALTKAREEAPALLIVDLNAGCCNAVELANAFKGEKDLKAIPLLGFFSHVQVELQNEAKQAGFDQVIPRSAFTRNLFEILKGPG